jgi:hypothetical protein
MKQLLYTLLLFINSLSFGQDITFEPIFVSQCPETPQPDEELHFWHLIDSNNNYYRPKIDSRSVKLPHKGKYTLSLMSLEFSVEIQISQYGHNQDTFHLNKLKLFSYISNPPTSDFMNCGGTANGKVVDHFYNGNVRLSGTFKDGQVIDTLKRYFYSGEIEEIFIPNESGNQYLYFYKNGQIKSDYNQSKRYEYFYYHTGQIKSKTKWNKKYKEKEKQYFLNGDTQLKRNHNRLKSLYITGDKKEKIKRREVLIFDRIFFSDSPYERYHKFYKYNWNSYDSAGLLTRQIQFNDGDFGSSNFPDSIQQIDDYLFSQITFYKQGKPYIKSKVQYFRENETYDKKMVVYVMKNRKWIQNDIKSIDQVYKFIEQYSN